MSDNNNDKEIDRAVFGIVGILCALLLLVIIAIFT